MDESQRSTEKLWPGGIATIVAGSVISLIRPFQKPFEIHSQGCPFEPDALKLAGRAPEFSSPHGDWLVIESLGRREPCHKLIIPRTCEEWRENRLRVLGGTDEIRQVLDLAYTLSAKQDRRDLVYLSVNIGHAGGQNVPHLHWHFVVPWSSSVKVVPWIIGEKLFHQLDSSAYTVLNNDYFRVAAGGNSVGQCFILPHHETTHFASLAPTIAELVQLYARMFKLAWPGSLAPDFTLGLVFMGGRFHYGTYVPILKHWGVSEHLALLGQMAGNIAWSHELTAAYLRGEVDTSGKPIPK